MGLNLMKSIYFNMLNPVEIFCFIFILLPQVSPVAIHV